MIKQLLNWFRRGHLESDLDRELKYHMDRRVDELMHSGVQVPEARRQAALEIGGLGQLREEVRDVWFSRWLRDFVFDLRFSVRSFLSSPSFTATAVLSLALGIGATTAIYSLVDQMVLHFLPVREPGRLVLVDWNGYQATVNAFGSYNLRSANHRKSTIITTNLGYDEWPNFLGNRHIVEAFLSRIRHHCHTVNINGPSLREPQG